MAVAAKSSAMNVYIGIDGGGTSSKFVLIDPDEKALATFISGSCNKNNIGFDKALQNVTEGIDALLVSAKKEKSEVSGVCLTTAGVETGRELWRAGIATFLGDDEQQSVRIEVHNDSVGDVA